MKSKWCIRFYPCLLVAYNFGPLFVAFVGGVFGAFLPLLLVSTVSVSLVKYSMTVLANAAAGAAAGIAAAAARRPARILISGLDVVRASKYTVRVEVVAVNDSSVTARDVSLYVSNYSYESMEFVLSSWRIGSEYYPLLLDKNGTSCCRLQCRLPPEIISGYSSRAVLSQRAKGVRVRGVAAASMPPRSMLEAPILEIEVLNVGEAEWLDCSSIRRCDVKGVERLVVVKIVSGGETLASLAAPLDDSWRGFFHVTMEVAGDPVPNIKYEVDVETNVWVEGGEVYAKIIVASGKVVVERVFHVEPIICES